MTVHLVEKPHKGSILALNLWHLVQVASGEDSASEREIQGHASRHPKRSI